MGLNDCKITENGVNTKGVVAEAGTRLTGTAEQNKAVFDRLVRELVATCVNGLIDVLKSTAGAGEIGESVDGLSGATVHQVLASVKSALDTKVSQSALELLLAGKEDKTETASLLKSVSFNAENGKFTFTTKGGSTTTVDTALEKVATNWAYDQSTQSLVLTLADGSTQSVSLGDFITEDEFLDSDQLDFSKSGHTITATIKAGSITDTMLSSALVSMLAAKVLLAESWAVGGTGSRTGEDTNNAMHFAGEASEFAEKSEGFAVGENDPESPYYHNNAKYYSELAESAVADAEAHAVGTREGSEITDPADPCYQNSAKYHRDRAEEAKDDAVTAMGKAEKAVGKTSYIGANGNWYEWNAETGSFVDTDVPAKGDTGDCNFATFEINPETGILAATYTTDNSEIIFAINNGCLEVQI